MSISKATAYTVPSRMNDGGRACRAGLNRGSSGTVNPKLLYKDRLGRSSSVGTRLYTGAVPVRSGLSFI